MGLSHTDAGSDVILGCGGQGHVKQPQVALEAAVEVVGKRGFAHHTIKAQGPIPGLQVCLGHHDKQQPQGVLGQAPLSLCKELFMLHLGYSQQGHAQGRVPFQRCPLGGRVGVPPVLHPSQPGASQPPNLGTVGLVATEEMI